MSARAAIYGLSGLRLTAAERAFFTGAEPWGFILFARNIEGPAQVKALVDDLRSAVGWQAPVLIDQEGGRVARLGAPHWRVWPAPAEDASGPDGAERLSLRTRLIAHELAALGIDVCCAPMLDVPGPGAHEIVASRVLGVTAREVAARGRILAEALLAGGVLPVAKHVPGHGRTATDSHVVLPVVAADLETLTATDFAPFAALGDLPLAMTAHVVYPAIDPERPATLSPMVIRLIRERIGVSGALMSDDLSMGALAGPMRGRAAAALSAGCDLLLHCNGDLAEMAEVAAVAPPLAGHAADRADAALAARRPPEPFDPAEAAARYAALAGEAA